MTDPDVIFNKIREAISAGLPGESAQFRMAPPFRAKLMQENEGLPEPRKAAVLIPVFLNPEGFPSLVLTLRKMYDGVHSGQVSFPGGKFDPRETDPIEVALRESFEEIGLPEHAVRIAGLLSPLYIPPSHILVHPVVGFITEPLQLQPQEREVERILFARMESLTNDLIREKAIRLHSNLSVNSPYFEVEGETVWGATAMILSEWLEVWGRITNEGRMEVREFDRG